MSVRGFESLSLRPVEAWQSGDCSGLEHRRLIRARRFESYSLRPWKVGRIGYCTVLLRRRPFGVCEFEPRTFRMHHASVAEQADAVGSNPTGPPCRFESCRWHQADVAKAAKAAGLNPVTCEFEARHRHRARRSPCSHGQGLHALGMAWLGFDSPLPHRAGE
jgi:hypothetical protein